MNPHLVCCLCRHDPAKFGVVEPALYVIDGYSVCEQHAAYAEAPMPYAEKVRVLREKGGG